MNYNSLLDKFDRLINQTKEYISEKDKKNIIIRKIETEAAEIQAGVISKREEIEKLIQSLENTETEYAMQEQLRNSLNELDFIEKNVLVMAENKWISDFLKEEAQRYLDDQVHEREKYAQSEIRRIKNELHEIESFYDIAEFVNQVWADQDIFREFSLLDDIIREIVQRMNETNQKGSETHLSKDAIRTLEHVRVNLFKNNSWSDEDIKSYQQARNREIRKHKVFTAGSKQKITFYIIGASEDLIEFIKEHYALPDNVRLKWVDICNRKSLNEFSEAFQVIIATYFPQNELFAGLIDEIKKSKINFTILENYSPSLIHKVIEDSFSKFSLKNLFT